MDGHDELDELALRIEALIQEQRELLGEYAQPGPRYHRVGDGGVLPPEEFLD